MTRTRSRNLGPDADLPPQRGADLLHQRHQLQPARAGRVGQEFQATSATSTATTASTRTCSVPPETAARGVPVDRGHQQLPAAAQGSHRLHRAPRRQAEVRLPDVRRGDRGAVPRNSAPRSGSPRPSCAAAGQQDRDRAHRQQGRRAVACRTCWPRSRATRTVQGRREGRARPRPGAAVGLRRLGPHHLLHQVRSRLPQARARDRRRGRDQDHEADRLPRLGDRGLRHQAGHHRRPADDRAGRLQAN